MCFKELLLNTLEDLGEEEFEKFKWYLQDHGIPKCQLDKAARLETVDKIRQKYNNQQSREMIREILGKINRNDLVEKLSSSSCTGDEETDGDTDEQKKRISPVEVFPRPHIIQASSCAHIQEEQGRVEPIKLHQKKLQQTQEALKKHKAEMKSNENFTVEVDEVYKVKERINGGRKWWQLWLFYEGAVCCTVCEENCHYPCKLAWYPKYCQVMSNNHCTGCTGKCPVSAHVKGQWRYVTKTKKIYKILQHMKEKYGRSEADYIQAERRLERLQTETVQATDTVLSEAPQSLRHAVTLNPTTVNDDSQSTLFNLDSLIKENGDSSRKNDVQEEIQKPEETKFQVKEEARSALPHKLTAVGEADPDTVKSISHKFDFICNKNLISSGSPSVYQLLPKKENIGTLKKMSLGRRDVNRTNRTILLVGETGAGKSTLINTLVNYAIGVTWEDNLWFEIVEEEKTAQSESQTPDVIVYEIFGFEDKTLPYSLTIIDTPGYGDTRGTEQDDKVSQRLFDLFRSNDGVYEMNVVGLVLKASDNRLSDRLRYVFDSVISLFGKDLEEHIITLITHSDGRTPQDALKAIEKAGISCAKKENQPVHFLFNNCQNSERNEKNLFVSQASWEITNRGMSEFTRFLQNLLPKNLKNTIEVLNSRIALTACIQNLQERVELIEKEQNQILQTKEALKKHEEEMESNQNFTVEVDVPYKVKEKIPGGMWGLVFYQGAVTCNNCEENCHYPGCTMAWYPRDCEVMSRGKCTSCKGKCLESDHVKKPEKYVTKTERVVMTIQDVKEKYEKSVDAEKDKKCLEDLEMAKHLMKEFKEKNEQSKADSVADKSKREDPEEEKKHLEEFKKAKDTLEEKKEKYKKSKADREETTGLLADLERHMEKLQMEKVKWLTEAFQHVVTLEQIALNTDSLSTHIHLDFLVEKMKECRLGSEKDKFKNEVQKLEDMKRRVDDQKTRALKYKQTTSGKSR